MTNRLILFVGLLLAAFSTFAEDYSGYSLEEANEFRQQWTIDNWDDGGPLTRYVFLNMPEFWKHSVIDRSGTARPLPEVLRSDVADFVTRTDAGEISLADYVNDPRVDGVLVIHHGQIVFEAYPRMRRYDKHLYMSVSKTLAATLIAILEDRELIDVSKAVNSYVPELSNSGWAGVPVRDVLDMASGIDCRQNVPGAYENPDLCYYQFEASLGWLRPTGQTVDDTHEYIAGLTSRRPSGEAFEYSSTNTFVLAWIAERVAGRPYTDLLSSEIWQRIGAESDAVMVAPKRGVQIASNGVSSTLRDLARFGLLFMPSGRTDLDPVVSDSYLQKIQKGGRPEIFNAGREDNPRLVDGELPLHNSWQWDVVMKDGDFFKTGYGGQGLYISPSRDLVIAFFGTLDDAGQSSEMVHVARQLAKSGLFDQ
jgi:CubicO group peptidase (beta-lactamase class C family)